VRLWYSLKATSNIAEKLVAGMLVDAEVLVDIRIAARGCGRVSGDGSTSETNEQSK
jgi:hypothetical protein